MSKGQLTKKKTQMLSKHMKRYSTLLVDMPGQTQQLNVDP